MARFETSVAAAFGVTLLVSATVGFLRREEEFARCGGLKGTRLLPDGRGRQIEFSLSSSDVTRGSGTLLLESGLGAPLETWDWIERLLADRFEVVRYHRSGYARSTTRLAPDEIVERLLGAVAPEGPLVIAGHSLGALVASEVLRRSSTVRERASALFIIDGTDERLLAEDRATPRRRGMFRQMVAQELVGDITGVNRWVQGRMERDVEYRPDIQRSFVVTSSSTRTQLTAAHEYARTPLGSQAWFREQAIPTHVLSASDNADQQARLAEYLGARHAVIPESSHRSIIGKLPSAQLVAQRLLAGAHGA